MFLFDTFFDSFLNKTSVRYIDCHSFEFKASKTPKMTFIFLTILIFCMLSMIGIGLSISTLWMLWPCSKASKV